MLLALLTALLGFFVIVVALAIAGVLDFDGEPEPLVFLALALATQPFFVGAAFLATGWAGVPARRLLGLRRAPLRVVLWGALAAVAGGMVGGGLAWVLQQALGEREGALELLSDSFTSGPAAEQPALLALLALGIAVGPALGEEFLCRGLIFGWLRRRGAWPAILGSALCFSAIHLDPVQGAATLLLGLVLGGLRELSGSLWPCVVGHLANNALACLALAAGGGTASGDGGETGVVALVGALLGAAALLRLGRERR